MNLKKIPKSAVLALAGLIFALVYVINANKPTPPSKELRQPPKRPYVNAIAGLGIVEAREENIQVANYWDGKVVQVWVHEGDRVKAGDTLFALDTLELEAQLASQQAQVAVEQARLNRLKHQPRAEDLPPLQAAVQQAEIALQDAEAQLVKLERVSDPRSISQDERDRKRFAVAAAKAQAARARADLARAKAGAWTYEIAESMAGVKATQSRIRELQVQKAHAVIRAPQDGQVLQVNVHPGEFVNSRGSVVPVLLGNTDELQVRVDVDEVNASHVRPGMTAQATLKGNATAKIPLRFVRVEPYMVPKKNLSGSNLERVDVRVLQLIYAFDPPSFPVYVGQQVDVYLDRRVGVKAFAPEKKEI